MGFPAHATLFHHRPVSPRLMGLDTTSPCGAFFFVMLSLYSNPRGKMNLIFFRFASICNGYSACFGELPGQSIRLANLGICNLVLSEMGAEKSAWRQFKSFQRNKKNSSQKSKGAFAVTTGLPERPRIAMETAHFFFYGAGT